MAPTLRPPSAKIVVAVVLTLISRPTQAQQLGSTFTLDDQQTAVARVAPGQFVRVRLKDGTRAGGPLIRATPLAFTVGPSVAFGDQDSVLRLRSVDSMWMRVYSTRRGTVVGGVVGGLLGLALGATSASICPEQGDKACAQGAVTSAAGGVAVGALFGSLFGSGRSHWRRLLPQESSPRLSTGAPEATIAATADTTVFDPRAVALMRTPRNVLVRLTFEDRGDLGGYVLRSGARGAVLGVVVGHAPDEPIPITSLEGIWQRGDARRTGGAVGILVGSLVGVVIATQSSGCNPHSACRTTILGDGLAFGLAGLFVGNRAGRLFPQWHRRF